MINSIEVKYSYNKDNSIKIDEDFMNRRLKAYKQMFPNLDTLGWYSSSNNVNSDFPLDGDLKI